MKCPRCAGDLHPGKVTVHAGGVVKLMMGQAPQHCFFQPSGLEPSEEELLVGSGKPQPAFGCPECEIVIVWGPNWATCPKCDAPINPSTRAGLHSPDDEPWRLLCDECEAEIQPDAV